MRKDIHGGVKKYVLLSRGVGMRSIKEGERKRKLVRGNMITEEIYQINCVLIGSNLPDKKTAPAESEEKEANKPQK
jgi:small subunit ribosomal protein S6e